jgi:quercetin dioxygenase-like cupin family protein
MSKKQALLLRHGEGHALGVMGSQVRFLCGGDQTERAWSMMECAVPRDVGPPPHHHDWDEAYYVIAGEFRFWLDGREHTIKAGDFIYAPAGIPHGFAGAADGISRLLVMDAPAHAEGFFHDAEREVREMPRDLAKVPAIGARHGIQFLPR